MEALLALLVAAVASFVGSLQAGLVNTAVLATTFRHGRAMARSTALGGALPELLYAAIAFVAANRILAWTEGLGITPERITAVVLAGLGLYIIFGMKPFHIKDEPDVRSGFRRGLLLGLMNPQLALFWCGVRLGSEALGIKLHGWGALAGFSLGAFLGAMALLLLLIRVGGHLRERMADTTLLWLFRALGVVLVVAGVWAWLA
jgi:threonine/homoserine/homoserine lactone efflux protein